MSALPMRTVLVLEDEVLIAALIQELVEELGCTVLTTVDLAVATDLFARQTFDFAILDINIAGRCSFPLADDLKRRRIPFLFTTGYASGEIDPRFRCPVIAKPFDPSFMQGVVAGYLGLPMPGR